MTTQRSLPECTLVIITGGAGDTGLRLAQRLLDAHDIGLWLTSREPSAVELDGVVVREWAGADDSAGFADLLEDADHAGYRHVVVFNVIGAWLRNPREAIVGVVEALTEAARGAAISLRIVHCSATSVYGDRPGEVLTEDSELSPALEVGRIHAEAENRLLDTPRDYEAVALRIPHIYGPDRERTVDMMAEGNFVVAGDGRNPMSHIHVEDLVRAMEAAAVADVDGDVINVVDDRALPYGAYCDFITDWYDREPLPRVPLDEALAENTFAELLGPGFEDEQVVREFYLYMTSHAAISNDKMKERLGIELRYPLFSDGLASLLTLRDAD